MSCWLLAIYVPKSDKLLLIIQKASISNYRCHAIKYSCPKKLVLKSFLDTILQSRSLCYGQNRRNYQIVFKHYEAFCVLKQWNTYVTEMNLTFFQIPVFSTCDKKISHFVILNYIPTLLSRWKRPHNLWTTF